jgi:hypothetical protein
LERCQTPTTIGINSKTSILQGNVMLQAHLNAVENTLVSMSKIQNNTGHTLHKGTPREVFIKEFLENHLPEEYSIGTGEIIDCNSRPGQSRNQYDIVIYKRNYPKLNFGGGISGFLIESVLATIEVKSNLTKEEFEKAVIAARNSKILTTHTTRIVHNGTPPPKILNYIVAFDGPANMQTVYQWIAPTYEKNQIPITHLPVFDKQRLSTPADAIDGVFILNKGFLYYDNVSYGFGTSQTRSQMPDSKWIYSNSENSNLLFLFAMIQQASANWEVKIFSIHPYISRFHAEGLNISP